MKRTLLSLVGRASSRAIPLLLSGCFLSGCARFGTVQTDSRYDEKGNLSTKITTRASSFTFFESQSQLANWKARQSEATQSAEVGSLTQSASGTNSVAILHSIENILKTAGP